MGNQRVFEDRTLRMESYRNVMLGVWSDAPTVQQLRRFARGAESFSQANPGGQALVNLFVGGVPSFSDPVREEVTKLLQTAGLFTLGTAHIVLVSGMAGSAVRAFLSTTMLVGRPANPNRVFGSVPDATKWLHPRLGGVSAQWTENELREAALGAARGRIPAR